jgi:hypothetical protein
MYGGLPRKQGFPHMAGGRARDSGNKIAASAHGMGSGGLAVDAMAIGCLGVERRVERFFSYSAIFFELLAEVLASARTPNSSRASTVCARLKDLCITAATVGAGVAMPPSPQQCLPTAVPSRQLSHPWAWTFLRFQKCFEIFFQKKNPLKYFILRNRGS